MAVRAEEIASILKEQIEHFDVSATSANVGTVIEAGDEVFIIAATENLRGVMRELRRMDKPVKRVMLGGGGSTDVMGRLFAAKLSERLGQQFVVDNRQIGRAHV